MCTAGPVSRRPASCTATISNNPRGGPVVTTGSQGRLTFSAVTHKQQCSPSLALASLGNCFTSSTISTTEKCFFFEKLEFQNSYFIKVL